MTAAIVGGSGWPLVKTSGLFVMICDGAVEGADVISGDIADPGCVIACPAPNAFVISTAYVSMESDARIVSADSATTGGFTGSAIPLIIHARTASKFSSVDFSDFGPAPAINSIPVLIACDFALDAESGRAGAPKN